MAISSIVARIGYALTALIAGVSVGGGQASAHPSWMLTGGLTSQPIGHYEFCKRMPEECEVQTRDERPVRISKKVWTRLVAVTKSVNEAVKPVHDIDAFGRDEYWAYPDGTGDCEDYVLQKRRLLAADGLSLSNLLITVVRKPDGEGHAVLTVRTTEGDLILDNLTDQIRRWDETDYLFVKRQATGDTGRWVTIREGHVPLVAAVD